MKTGSGGATMQSKHAATRGRPIANEFGDLILDRGARFELKDIVDSDGVWTTATGYDRRIGEQLFVDVLIAHALSSAARDRLLEILEQAQSVDHEGVLHVLGFQSVDIDDAHDVYIAIEKSPAQSLGSLTVDMESKPLERNVAALAVGIADAVQAIHSANICGVPTTVDNIQIGPSGDVLVPGFCKAMFPHPGYKDMICRPSNAADIRMIGDTILDALRVNDIEEIDDVTLRQIASRASGLDGGSYETADMLSQDLNAWLEGHPVVWTKPGLPRRLVLWMRRERLQAVAVMLIFALAAAALFLGAQAVAYKRVSKEQKARLDGAADAFDKYIRWRADRLPPDATNSAALEMFATILQDGGLPPQLKNWVDVPEGDPIEPILRFAGAYLTVMSHQQQWTPETELTRIYWNAINELRSYDSDSMTPEIRDAVASMVNRLPSAMLNEPSAPEDSAESLVSGEE